MLRLRLLDLLLGRAGLKRGCMGRSLGIGAAPLNWPSGTGTDIDRPILSASPWYRALLRKRLVSEGMVGTEGGRSSSCPFPPYLGWRIARGVAGSPTGIPEREELESELLG